MSLDPLESAEEHDPFSHAAAEQMAEPSWHEIPAHEPLSIEQVAGEPEKPDQGIIFDAVEDELPAAYLEQATEPISISSLDLRDVEALADRFAEGIAGPSEPKAPEVPEERLSVDAVRGPAGLIRVKKQRLRGRPKILRKPFRSRLSRPRRSNRIPLP